MKRTTLQGGTAIHPRELHSLIASGAAPLLLDVRTPGEFGAAHVPGAALIPLDDIDAGVFERRFGGGDSPVYVLCQSGGRARNAIEKLERAGVRRCVLVEGGTREWMDAGLPVITGSSKALPLMRQVQITVGFVSAAGAVLALAVNPLFAIVPLVMGCGLLFAGLTGLCGLAVLLAKMPWNRAHSGGSCCETRKEA